MAAAESEDGLNQAIVAFFNQCLPWFDYATANLNYALPNGIAYAYRDRIAAIKRANAPKPDPVVEPEPEHTPVQPENTDVAPAATDDNVDLSRIKTDLVVRVKGDGTRANKERFKELGLEWMKDNPDYSAPFYWKGSGARWLSKKEAWEMPYGAWAMFKAKYPSELHHLSAEVSN